MSAYDILLTDAGDLPLQAALVRGPEVIAQHIRRRMLTFGGGETPEELAAGEWPFDRRVGLPWLRWREQKNVPLEEIRERVIATIEATNGVVEVRDVEITFDLETRTVAMDGTIIIDDGNDELRMDAIFPLAGNRSATIAFIVSSGAIIL